MRYSSRPGNVVAFLILILLVTPSVAFANAGTPLMWAGAFHLLIGNALIGILEGAILAIFFPVSYARAVLLMVLADYFSAWLGWFWIQELSRNQNEIDLYGARRVIWKMFVVTYVATIVLEWPFVAGCFWKTSHWFRRSLLASLLIQSTSYLFLFLWYQHVSVNSILTETVIVTPDQIALPSDVRIYFVSDVDGDVYTSRLSGGPMEKIFDVPSAEFAYCLSIEAFNRDSEVGQLVVVAGREYRHHPGQIPLNITFPAASCPAEKQSPPATRRYFPDPDSLNGVHLGSALESPWSCEAGWYPTQGLSGENSQTGARFRVGLEVPCIQWDVRHPIVLPGDLFLFELGERQICIFDPKTKKVAVVARGHGVIAVIDAQSQKSE